MTRQKGQQDLAEKPVETRKENQWHWQPWDSTQEETVSQPFCGVFNSQANKGKLPWPKLTQFKISSGFEIRWMDWEGRKRNKEEIPGSGQSMHGYILTYPRF